MLFERFGIIAKCKHFFRWVKDRCHTECEEQMKDTVHIRNGIADHCHKYSEEPKPLPLMQQSQCANHNFSGYKNQSNETGESHSYIWVCHTAAPVDEDEKERKHADIEKLAVTE